MTVGGRRALSGSSSSMSAAPIRPIASASDSVNRSPASSGPSARLPTASVSSAASRSARSRIRVACPRRLASNHLQLVGQRSHASAAPRRPAARSATISARTDCSSWLALHHPLREPRGHPLELLDPPPVPPRAPPVRARAPPRAHRPGAPPRASRSPADAMAASRFAIAASTSRGR